MLGAFHQKYLPQTDKINLHRNSYKSAIRAKTGYIIKVSIAPTAVKTCATKTVILTTSK